MKNIIATTAAALAITATAAAADQVRLTSTASYISECGFGAGLGPDLVCSTYVQGEFYGKAAHLAGYADADMRTAPEVRFSDLIGDTYLADDGVIVIGVDGNQNDLYNLYLRWMDRNGHVTNAEVSQQIAARAEFVAPPLGYDFDGSVLSVF